MNKYPSQGSDTSEMISEFIGTQLNHGTSILQNNCKLSNDVALDNTKEIYQRYPTRSLKFSKMLNNDIRCNSDGVSFDPFLSDGHAMERTQKMVFIARRYVFTIFLFPVYVSGRVYQ